MHRTRDTGLYLGRDNQLINVPAGQAPPPDDALLPLMPPHEVALLRHWTVAEMTARCVRPAQRDFQTATLDAVLPGHGWQLAPVIGWGLSQHRSHQPAVADPQGFSVEWLRVPAATRNAGVRQRRWSRRGTWRLDP